MVGRAVLNENLSPCLGVALKRSAQQTGIPIGHLAIATCSLCPGRRDGISSEIRVFGSREFDPHDVARDRRLGLS